MNISGLGGVTSAKEEDSSSDVRQLVIFNLVEGSYGVDIQYVREINRLSDITPIPKAPEFVEGIINLRGTIVPVVNLSKRFGLAKMEHTKDTRIVVVESGGYTLGLEVDEVSEVLRIPAEEIDSAMNLNTTGIDIDFVEGVGKVDGRLILILNTGKLFTAEEHAQMAEISDN